MSHHCRQFRRLFTHSMPSSISSTHMEDRPVTLARFDSLNSGKHSQFHTAKPTFHCRSCAAYEASCCLPRTRPRPFLPRRPPCLPRRSSPIPFRPQNRRYLGISCSACSCRGSMDLLGGASWCILSGVFCRLLHQWTTCNSSCRSGSSPVARPWLARCRQWMMCRTKQEDGRRRCVCRGCRRLAIPKCL
jgi:hypothetical protein